MENKRTTEQNRADELLRMALEDHILQAEPELKKKDELQKDGDLHKFSPEFEERFENMLRESQNKKKTKNRKPTLYAHSCMFPSRCWCRDCNNSFSRCNSSSFMSFILSMGQESGEMVGDEENHIPSLSSI